MIGLEIDSTEDKFSISLDKNIFDKEIIISIIERLKVESIAKEVDFSENIIDVSNDIKTNWWKENKVSYLDL